MTDAPAPGSNRCFVCGYDNPNGLHEHHIVPRAYGGGDAPENLTWLCASCHEAIHKLYDERFYQRLGVEAALAEESPLVMDVDGEKVDAKDSLDRRIPRHSEHVRFEVGDDDDVAQLHCGYCRSVFPPEQHPNMARHLQLRHGIEDPYTTDNLPTYGFEEVDKEEIPDDVEVI